MVIALQCFNPYPTIPLLQMVRLIFIVLLSFLLLNIVLTASRLFIFYNTYNSVSKIYFSSHIYLHTVLQKAMILNS